LVAGGVFAAATVNELRSLRVDQAALKGQQLDMSYVESPRQVEEREEDFEQKQQIRAEILKQLTGGDAALSGDSIEQEEV
jgi:hypothetical protein